MLSRQEICPYCDKESIIDTTKFELQTCSECGRLIVPCSLCETLDCGNCPLERQRFGYEEELV